MWIDLTIPYTPHYRVDYTPTKEDGDMDSFQTDKLTPCSSEDHTRLLEEKLAEYRANIKEGRDMDNQRDSFDGVRVYDAMKSRPVSEFEDRDDNIVPDVALDGWDRAATELATLLRSKQADYGPENILTTKHVGLAVRLTDKIARLRNLTMENKDPKNESVRDTYMDIAGYGIIGMLLLDGGFPDEV